MVDVLITSLGGSRSPSRGAGSSQPATRAHPAQATLPHLREGWGEVDPEATKLQKSGTLW